jgi:hypothetical protein
MAMYSFEPRFCEAKFCGVPSCVFDKLGCAAGEKSLWNTAINNSSTHHQYKLSATVVQQ